MKEQEVGYSRNTETVRETGKKIASNKCLKKVCFHCTPAHSVTVYERVCVRVYVCACAGQALIIDGGARVEVYTHRFSCMQGILQH